MSREEWDARMSMQLNELKLLFNCLRIPTDLETIVWYYDTDGWLNLERISTSTGPWSFPRTSQSFQTSETFENYEGFDIDFEGFEAFEVFEVSKVLGRSPRIRQARNL